MRIILQPDKAHNLLTCYAMIMERTLDELDYLLRGDYRKSKLDFIATTFGWAPVHLPTSEIPTDQIIKYSWPNKLILTNNQKSVVYDPTEEYFYDPDYGLRKIEQLPLTNYITIFYWYQQHYDD